MKLRLCYDGMIYTNKGPVLVYYTNYPILSSFMNSTETHVAEVLIACS